MSGKHQSDNKLELSLWTRPERHTVGPIYSAPTGEGWLSNRQAFLMAQSKARAAENDGINLNNLDISPLDGIKKSVIHFTWVLDYQLASWSYELIMSNSTRSITAKLNLIKVLSLWIKGRPSTVRSGANTMGSKMRIPYNPRLCPKAIAHSPRPIDRA